MELEAIIEQKSTQLLHRAIEFGASDLHLMPMENHYTIMFRKYGRFIEAGQFPQDLGLRIISYFKYLSALDISESRKPQSGAFQQCIQQQNYACRVSTLPTALNRESVAIRLMPQQMTHTLQAISYSEEDASTIEQLASNSQGLILFSGATGSGKTTSLYSLLHYCTEQLGRHVISLEDPVESSQRQLLQIQVNERAGITYATGLRAILRHSPDIIMIGEIRDKETAKIAVEAAFTGHLVVSTIHAKDSINCLYRLLDLGNTLEDLRQVVLGIISQTLVAINRDEQRAIYEILSEPLLTEVFEHIQQQKPIYFPHAKSLAYQKERILNRYASSS